MYVSDDGTLRFGNRLCVTNDSDNKRLIIEETHLSSYSVHLGSTKMYYDLCKIYWSGKKRELFYRTMSDLLTLT
jgi:hypothetical protein